MKLVECVPNFSEGRDQTQIDHIASAIRAIENVILLDVDPGKDANRTVVTFIGSPEGVLEAAFQAIAEAAEVIDMTTQSGEHARLGATDVCPFVPVSDVTMEECVQLAKTLGVRVASELNIPVYLYEEAATTPSRQNLADVRSGEYEGLEDKLKDPKWKPDYGDAKFNAKSGATVIGARPFLIAYNLNLNTKDVGIAKEIAGLIRESGRMVRDADGSKKREPGLLKACKAVGWYMEDFGCAQISMNLTDFNVTPPHIVYDTCSQLAEERGTCVTGSELVGLIPLEAMRQAGIHYLKKQDKTIGVPEAKLIQTAVQSLGLDDLSPFDPSIKIIEYWICPEAPLAQMSLNKFADELSTNSPAPGGGSVAALCGALSSALSSMVAALSYPKQADAKTREAMEAIGVKAQQLKAEFLLDVDRDTDAFNRFMAAMRMKKKTEDEKQLRAEAMESALQEAVRVPLSVLERCVTAAELAFEMVQKGNKSSVSDAAVGVLCARTAAEGAYLNVMINLKDIKTESFRKENEKKAKALKKKVNDLVDCAMRDVEGILGEKK
ncbi:glutamate formimidoyltransferase [candidate division KSB1 bacterium]|nr:glutamate formimidoyltransferase [candidate division KSB1 bacterium]